MARDFGEGNMRRFRFSAMVPFAAAAVLSAATSVNAIVDSENELWSAVRISGNPDTAQRSPAVGANPNVPQSAGRTAVRLASDTTSPAVRPGGGAPERKADVANGKGETSLRLVAEAHRSSAGLLWSAARTPGNLEIVRRLLASGVNPNIPDDAGRTAVHRAASGGGPRILAALLRAGGKPNVRDRDGNAPLHIAIKAGGSEGKVEAVEALLAAGADPCLKDATGLTPYRMAADGGPIRRALGRAGGNEWTCGRNGKRTMRVAARTNVRSGPGPHHARIGTLDAGYEVKVAGKIGDWLRIEMPGGEGYVRVERMIDTAFVASLEPKCDGFSHECLDCGLLPDRPACRICRDFPVCWRQLSNRPECYLLVPNNDGRNRSLNWSGSCSGGVANGQGKLSSSRNSIVETGMLVGGKKHGPWIGEFLSSFSSALDFATYVDGKRDGLWISRSKLRIGKSNEVSTNISAYVNGKEDGKSSFSVRNGGASMGAYVNGKRHGQWVDVSNSLVTVGAYVNGKRHGRWVELFGLSRPGGVVSTGVYVDGRKHGRWKRRSITTCEIVEYESGWFARKRKC